MQAVTNLIALGDNVFEIQAAHKLYQQFQSAFIKTIKFRSGPSTGELTKQIKLVLEQFNHICHSPKNLTVRLHRIDNEEDNKPSKKRVDGHSQGSYTGTGDHTAGLVKGLVAKEKKQRTQSTVSGKLKDSECSDTKPRTSSNGRASSGSVSSGNIASMKANAKKIERQQKAANADK